MGKLTYNEADFQKAAIQFDRELLKIPLLALAGTLQFMTVRRGVRGTVLVGQESVDAEFAPYKRNRKTDVNLDLKLRPLSTYFSSLNANFDPNESMQTLLDHRANQAMADGLQSTPTAREVLALIGKKASSKIVYAIFKGVRNPNGTTSMDLFDGFDTISAKDVTSGEVSVENGNYVKLDEEITPENAYEVITGLLDHMSEELRGQKAYLYCSRKIADAYNKGYKKANAGIAYNTGFKQTFVEGSEDMLQIVPLPGKVDSKYIHISTKENMLFGCDQESDAEYVKVKEYEPDTLTYMMRAFFGAQIKSVDKSQFLLVELPSDYDVTTDPSESEDDQTNTDDQTSEDSND